MKTRRFLVPLVVAVAVMAVGSACSAQTAGVWADYWMSSTTVSSTLLDTVGDVTVAGYSTVVGAEAEILPKVVIGGEYAARLAGTVTTEDDAEDVEFTESDSLMDVWLGYKLLADETMSFYPLVGYVSGSMNLGATWGSSGGDVTVSMSGFVVGAGATLSLGNALSASGRLLYAYSLTGTSTVDEDLVGLAPFDDGATLGGSGYVGEAKLSYAVLPQVVIEAGYRLASWTVYDSDAPDATLTDTTAGLFVGVGARF